MMRILTLIFFILFSSSSYGDDVQSFLQTMEELRKAAFDSVNSGNDPFGQIQRQVFGAMNARTTIKHRYHHTTSGVSIEFDLPKNPESELNFDIQEQYIVVESTIVKQIGNTHSSQTSRSIVQLPSGIDFEKPRIEQKKEKLFIHFKKKAPR